MEKLSVSRQTLESFLKNPFNTKNTQKHLKYEDRYQKFKKSNKIRIAGTMILERDYFIHLKVPSESQKGLYEYDVVIQFSEVTPKQKSSLSISEHYVQFFSNSPGFVYKYAALYQLEGYLISSLQDKFAPTTLETLPDKANKNYELYYDSSIYYACRYLQDHKLTYLGKLTMRYHMKKSPTMFFKDIQDIESSEIDRTVAGIEKKLLTEVKTEKKLSEQQENKLGAKNTRIFKQIKNKRMAEKNTLTDKSKATVVKKAGKSTSGSSSIKRVGRKKSKKG